jgi:MtN3 and saliva related transmembrane protein
MTTIASILEAGYASQEHSGTREAVIKYLLKPGSPMHLRALQTFEPLRIITGIVTPFATIPSISKLYVTHTEHASGQSLITWSVFACASLLWVVYGLLNRKAPIYIANAISLAMNSLMVIGILMHGGWTY